MFKTYVHVILTSGANDLILKMIKISLYNIKTNLIIISQTLLKKNLSMTHLVNL